MLVREIMSKPVVTVREEATLEEVARLMLEHNVGCVPVVDEHGKLRGLVTEASFMAKAEHVPFTRHALPKVLGEWLPQHHVETVYRAARTTAVREVMIEDVVTASEDQIVADVVRVMLGHGLHRIPVLRDGIPVGVVTRHDLLKLMV